MNISVEVVMALGAVLVALIHFLHVLVLRPKSLRGKLHTQGIRGPSPDFYFGNIKEMNTLLLQQQNKLCVRHKEEQDEDVCVSISHKWTSTLFPHIQKWRSQYGHLLSPFLPPLLFYFIYFFIFLCLVMVKVKEAKNTSCPLNHFDENFIKNEKA